MVPDNSVLVTVTLKAQIQNISQNEKKDLSRKIESIKASQDEKKKKLFADLEKQLKKSKR